MQRQMLKSKIHRATVTDCDPDYVGSITIDNGTRFLTYVLEGRNGSGEMQVNGAAARLVNSGHKVIVASFASYDERDLEAYSPIVVHVDAANEVVRVDSNPEVLLGSFVPAWGPDEIPGAFSANGESGAIA